MQTLKSILDRIGLKQTELASLLAVSPRTVSLWATGDSDLPGPVAAYLRVLQDVGPDLLSKELSRLEGRPRKFDEGIYGLNYTGEHAGQRDGGDALAVLRAGKIFGSDRWGGIFSGSYYFDPGQQTNQVHVRVQVPPDGELVTGFSGGQQGATVDIVAALGRAAPVATAVVDIAGQPVELKLTYLGPLPN
jgi:transcriptional regulator with XRE-family HTH domain